MSLRGLAPNAICSGMGLPPVVIPAYAIPRGAGQTGPRINETVSKHANGLKALGPVGGRLGRQIILSSEKFLYADL